MSGAKPKYSAPKVTELPDSAHLWTAVAECFHYSPISEALSPFVSAMDFWLIDQAIVRNLDLLPTPADWDALTTDFNDMFLVDFSRDDLAHRIYGYFVPLSFHHRAANGPSSAIPYPFPSIISHGSQEKEASLVSRYYAYTGHSSEACRYSSTSLMHRITIFTNRLTLLVRHATASASLDVDGGPPLWMRTAEIAPAPVTLPASEEEKNRMAKVKTAVDVLENHGITSAQALRPVNPRVDGSGVCAAWSFPYALPSAQSNITVGMDHSSARRSQFIIMASLFSLAIAGVSRTSDGRIFVSASDAEGVEAVPAPIPYDQPIPPGPAAAAAAAALSLATIRRQQLAAAAAGEDDDDAVASLGSGTKSPGVFPSDRRAFGPMDKLNHKQVHLEMMSRLKQYCITEAARRLEEERDAAFDNKAIGKERNSVDGVSNPQMRHMHNMHDVSPGDCVMM